MPLWKIIEPVTAGLSLSRTAGAAHIGHTARMCRGGEIKRAELYMRGSFAITGAGRGTDKALIAKLMGMKADDPGIRRAFGLARQAELEFEFHTEDVAGAPAAAMTFTSLLGLVCGPVGGLVECPCIKHNGTFTANGVLCADMALTGIESAIPLGEVIDSMGQIGRMLAPALRETSLDGWPCGHADGPRDLAENRKRRDARRTGFNKIKNFVKRASLYGGVQPPRASGVMSWLSSQAGLQWLVALFYRVALTTNFLVAVVLKPFSCVVLQRG